MYSKRNVCYQNPPTCDSYAKVSPKNRVVFKAADEARSSDYRIVGPKWCHHVCDRVLINH